jgi:thiamine monophosphate kinase
MTTKATVKEESTTSSIVTSPTVLPNAYLRVLIAAPLSFNATDHDRGPRSPVDRAPSRQLKESRATAQYLQAALDISDGLSDFFDSMDEGPGCAGSCTTDFRGHSQ